MVAPTSRKTAPKRSAESGATFVEVAISCTLCLAAFLVALDLTQMAFRAAKVQHAIQKTARWAILGKETYTANLLVCNGATREASIRCYLRDQSKNLGVEVNDTSIQLCPESDMGCSAMTNDAGGPGELFSLRVRNYAVRSIIAPPGQKGLFNAVLPAGIHFSVVARSEATW